MFFVEKNELFTENLLLQKAHGLIIIKAIDIMNNYNGVILFLHTICYISHYKYIACIHIKDRGSIMASILCLT